MKMLFTAVLVLSVSGGVAAANAQEIQITPNGSTSSVIGTPENFSGHAIIDPLLPATENTHATTGLVTFAPGARTAWHTHPAGQALIVTSGKGWLQAEGQPRRDINPGDVVWIPVGVKHWHGATATNAMSHIAVSYMLDGKNVDWLELVSDEQYGAP